MVARAPCILRGKLVPAPGAIPDAPADQHLVFRVEKPVALKGHLAPAGADALFLEYLPASPGLVERVKALSGSDVIVFVRGYVKQGSPKGYYYTFGDDPKAVQAAVPARIAALRDEIRNQDAIASSFERSPLARPDRYHREVKEWIGGLFRAETEQQSVDALLKMGARAVPSLVRLMNDRRAVAPKLLAFPNKPRPAGSLPTGSPADFESHHYDRGERVVDVVVLVLSFITEESFDFLSSEATEEERLAAVRAWRVYLSYSRP